MNPYRIYRDEWAQALTGQVVAVQYTTFVAMPFQDRFSYHPDEILRDVIAAAAAEANRIAETARAFEVPARVDRPTGAAVITDEIVSGILQSHIFLADLTFENPGVLLETGIALGTKPNKQIILITQGPHDDLHFDIRNNNVVSYSIKKGPTSIAAAMVAAAKAFEEQANSYILTVTRRLSPEAIAALNWYGTVQKQHSAMSLHSQQMGPFFGGPFGIARFDAATRELRERDLLWTDYKPGAVPGGDAFGMHATEMGWAVIASMWPDLARTLG